MYLKQTLEFGIWYSASSSLDLVGFLDVDFARSGIDRKSTSDTCNLPFSRILSYLLVFSKTISSCSIHHLG
jgi:hypothetical protein